VTASDITTVLVAEECEATRTFIADNLVADGYDVVVAATLQGAVVQLHNHPVDLMVADLNGSTMALLGQLRASELQGVDPTLPAITLSSSGADLQRTRLLDAGADDALDKPFSYPELRARVAALLRRCRSRASRVLTVGPLRVDLGARVVTLRGTRLQQMTAREFGVLAVLASEPSRVFTKDELMLAVWGFDGALGTRTLDSHACRLRGKLCVQGDRFINNVWGVGYRLVDVMPS
jgi:DNA-binding response OmpR family regulator